jgi:bisphosphoglycerate-dependent phosphoglycerate mutase
MIYSGELNEKDIEKSTQYWVVEDPEIEKRTKKKFFGFLKGKEIVKYIKYPTFNGKVDLNKLNDLNNIKSNLNLNYFGNENSYTFFLCRHGEGIHNTMSFTKKIRNYSSVLNAPLTDVGRDQAIRAGMNLNYYLETNKLNINFLFASDLQRTQYTIGNIIQHIDPPRLELDDNDIYILPCSHEIVGKKGNCDNAGDFTSNENKASKTGVVEIDGKKINWNYYDSNFSRIKGGIKSEKCRNTNMFSQMIIMVNSTELEDTENTEESLFGETSLLNLRGGKTKHKKQKRKITRRKATRRKATRRKATKRKRKTQKRK